MNRLSATLALAGALTAGIACAQSTFQAFLSGVNEVPANGSTATGFGTVVLNAASNQITVNMSFSGLTGGNATAAHIHGPAPVGQNTNVLFGFTGVPSATSGAIPEQTFAINATQIGYLFNNLLYMNVHNGTFPGGEIRGQLSIVPEPGMGALVCLGGGGLLYYLRRRRNSKIET
jgi:hypothetical protein